MRAEGVYGSERTTSSSRIVPIEPLRDCSFTSTFVVRGSVWSHHAKHTAREGRTSGSLHTAPTPGTQKRRLHMIPSGERGFVRSRRMRAYESDIRENGWELTHGEYTRV